MGIIKKNFIYIILFLLLIIFFNGKLKELEEKLKKIEINNIDLQEVKDGEYEGECKVDILYAKVKVKVEKHRIISIKILKHKSGKGKDAEKIIDRIMDNQSLLVDAVSGATGSSKVILKAVEDALTKGLD